jgi:hypothetical protein
MELVDGALDELAQREEVVEQPLVFGGECGQGLAQAAGAIGLGGQGEPLLVCYIQYKHKESKMFLEENELLAEITWVRRNPGPKAGGAGRAETPTGEALRHDAPTQIGLPAGGGHFTVCIAVRSVLVACDLSGRNST